MPDDLHTPDGLNPPDEGHGLISPAPPIAETRVPGAAVPGDLAGFGKRLVGFVLDMAIIFLPWFVIAKLAAGSGKHDSGLVLVLGLIPLVASVIYAWAMLTYAKGQTLGMRLMGLRCIESSTGQPVSSKRAFGRAAAWLIFSVAWFVIIFDLLWPLWDKNNQTLHDKVASTYVVTSTTS